MNKCEICGKESVKKMENKHPYCSRSCLSHLIWKYKKKKMTEQELFESKKQICKKYEKTFCGYLMRKYRNMQSRIKGIQKQKHHLYKDLEILPMDEFYMWALSSEDYERLFCEYKDSGFNRKLAPTVDRTDSKKGYILENMRWLTHSENSRLGSISKNRRKNEKIF